MRRWHGFFDIRSPFLRLRRLLWWVHQNWLWLWPSASWCYICESWGRHLPVAHPTTEQVAAMSKAYELVGASMGALVASLGLTAQALEQMVKALPRVKEE